MPRRKLYQIIYCDPPWDYKGQTQHTGRGGTKSGGAVTHYPTMTVSEMKKRQEIGRGVRLPVNQTGERLTDLDFNILTVVANESYSDYVSKLQQEYVDDYGEVIAPPKPANARNRKVLKLRAPEPGQNLWFRRNPLNLDLG